MADADDIMSGVLIGGFIAFGIGVLGYCLRRKPTLKQSASHDDLVNIEDPQSS